MSRPEELRALNRLQVLGALRRHRHFTRSDLSRLTGLSASTVLSLVDELVAEGLVGETVPADKGPGAGRGRPAGSLRLLPKAGAVVGIALSRDGLCVAIGDLSIETLVERRSPMTSEDAPDRVLDTI